MTLIPVRHEVLTAQHEDTLKALLEPLGVALENDRRVHELAILGKRRKLIGVRC